MRAICGDRSASAAQPAPRRCHDKQGQTRTQLDIVIRHADGKVIAGIPQIALYATAENVAAALDCLERKKNILKDDIAAAGVFDPLPDAAAASAASPTDRIARFAIKSAIVAVMVLLVLAVSGGDAGQQD